MADDNNKKSSVIDELRRRHLFRAAGAYIVVAWLLVQIADTIMPIYDAPQWVLRAFVTLLVVGFTPAMIAAWLFDITRHGIEVTGDSPRQARVLASVWFRAIVGGITTIVTGIVVWWIWTGYLVNSTNGLSADRSVSGDRVVAITPIRNLSGDESLEWLGDGLANLVRNELAKSRHVVVVSKPRWDSITRDTGGGDAAYEAARDAGIEFVFSGEFISLPAGMYLSVRLTDLASGIERAAESFDALTAETMLGTGYRLGIIARQGLQLPHTESVDSFAADFVVNNMTAYEAYVGGLEYFRRFDYGLAEQSFGVALELAPQFHIARYRLSHVFMSTGRQSQAVATIADIPADAPFSRREQLYVDAARTLFEFDLDPAIATYRTLLDEYPYEVEARQFLAEAYFQNYQEDLAVKELRILAQQEPENEFIWGSMGTYLVLAGQLEEAEQPLTTYLELAAEKAHPLTMLGDLQRQRGNYEQSADYYTRALDANPGFAEARRGQAQVFTLIGKSDEAKATWREIIADGELPADERIYAAFDYSYVLRAEGQYRESLEPLLALEAEIKEERIREPMALATRAMSHLELGEPDVAQTLIDEALERNAASAPTRYLFARGLLELAESNYPAVRNTAQEIRTHALPPDNPDRTEERAAIYLEGLALLGNGDADAAVELLRSGIELGGYSYAVFELALARALALAGELDEARTLAEAAANYHTASEVRLDLELDRRRARQLQADLDDQLTTD